MSYNASSSTSERASSYNHSSRANQTRQLNQDEQRFADLLARMQTGGEIPRDDEIEQAGQFASDLNELRDSLELDGTPGLQKTLQALASNPKGKIASLLATIETTKQGQAQEEADPKTRRDQRGKLVFVTMTEDDIDQLPDIEYLISDMLQTATVSLVFGDSNVGKTFFALHTAQCVARDIQWFGHDVSPGPVLYIYAEGIRGLKPRSQAWRKKHDAGKTNNIQFIGFPVHLVAERNTLINTVSSLEDQRSEKYALIVVDTFSNCAGGISQNDQMEIAKVLATAHEIVRDYGAHVMVVHHTNNNGKFNGSAAFKNHVDTMVELKKPEATGPIIMRCEKQRDAEYFKDILLELEVINLGEDPKTYRNITSCVMTLSEAKLPAVEKAEQERTAMLDILREHGTLTQGKWMEACNHEYSISRKPFGFHLEYLKTRKMVAWTPENPKPRQAINYTLALTTEDIEKMFTKDNSGESDE